MKNIKQYEIIYSICKKVREELVKEHGKNNLYGTCIKASDKIIKLLSEQNIQSHSVEGWCMYEDEHYGSDRQYDEHTWVELEDKTYIDVTADQFSYGMFTHIPEIIIGKKPDYMVYNEPKYLNNEGGFDINEKHYKTND